MGLIQKVFPYVVGASIGGFIGSSVSTIPYSIKNRDKEFEQKMNNAYKSDGRKAWLQTQKDYFQKINEKTKAMTPDERQEKLKEFDKVPFFKYGSIGAILGALGTVAVKILRRK